MLPRPIIARRLCLVGAVLWAAGCVHREAMTTTPTPPRVIGATDGGSVLETSTITTTGGERVALPPSASRDRALGVGDAARVQENFEAAQAARQAERAERDVRLRADDLRREESIADGRALSPTEEALARRRVEEAAVRARQAAADRDRASQPPHP